jgi:hypothetical protein
MVARSGHTSHSSRSSKLIFVAPFTFLLQISNCDVTPIKTDAERSAKLQRSVTLFPPLIVTCQHVIMAGWHGIARRFITI